MLKAAENKIDEVTFMDYYSDIFSVNEDVVSLLPTLKEKFKFKFPAAC